MNYDKYEYLLVDVDADGVCTVTMNRPDALNAIRSWSASGWTSTTTSA